jgi:hypothetical protein
MSEQNKPSRPIIWIERRLRLPEALAEMARAQRIFEANRRQSDKPGEDRTASAREE